MTDHQSTIVEQIELGTQLFESAPLCFGHGTDNAWDEATMLVLASLDLPPDLSFDQGQRTVNAEQVEQLKVLFQRRVEERIPAAYLIGRAWFAGLEFIVDETVLVPRSPIAELIVGHFSPWLRAGSDIRVLDLCTGSACIAVAVAKYLPLSQVDASDLSADAIAVAQQNVVKHGVGDRLRLYQGDLFEPLGSKRYDLIVTNPPYVGRAEMAQLPTEYRQEPTVALSSGEDGLDLPLRIVLHAAEHLSEQGILILEVGNSDQLLQACLPQVPFTWLEFEDGGHGVCLLERQQLLDAHDFVAAALQRRSM